MFPASRLHARLWVLVLVFAGLLVAGLYFRDSLLGARHVQPAAPTRTPTAAPSAGAESATTPTSVASPLVAPSLTTAPAATFTGSLTTVLDVSGDILGALESARAPSTLVSRELVSTTLLSANPLSNHPLSNNGMGIPADQPVTGVAISADGRTVAFSTRASNLDAVNFAAAELDSQSARYDYEHGYEQIYVLDRETRTLELITLGQDGAPGDGWSSAPALSPDGRFVAFYSWAGNLVTGDTNAVQDAFLYDRRTATMMRVSVSSTGVQGNDRSGDSRAVVRPALSADGRFVAFHSRAANLVDLPADTPLDEPVAGTQVYLHDQIAGTTALISQDATGAPGVGESMLPTLSADGRVIAFQSRAANLWSHIADDPDADDPSAVDPSTDDTHWQIWRVDRAQEQWSLVSQAVGEPGNGDSTWPALAGDGSRLVFQSAATNLVTHDTNQAQDILLYAQDGEAQESEALQRVSVTAMGVPATRDASMPVIALDGRYVAFTSAANNLVDGDTNAAPDLFLHDLATRHTSRVSVGVVAAWTGLEADGATVGPAALAAGGRWVAFVSAAPNLLAATGTRAAENVASWPAQAYLHERRAPPVFRVGGRVVDNLGQPIAEVTIRAGAQRAATDATGAYSFAQLVGGTYALSAEHNRYSFSPSRRIVSVLGESAQVNFTGFAGVDQTRAFLDLPFAYDGTAASFLQALRDTAEGGLVDAWFDHAFPDYVKTGTLTLWDGNVRDVGLYNQELGCYQRRCYDGHDGVDFPYRDRLVDLQLGAPVIRILPAAPGQVVHVVDSCDQADRWCNGGYGNEVILGHENGYFTRYSHLAQANVSPGQTVTRADTLGHMGNTGNSYGIHLHFGVHQDDGNTRWDGDSVDLPVDPFGWGGAQPDPWVAARGGPISHWLWRSHPTAENVIVGSMGGVLRDVTGNLAITFPGGAFAGQARLELAPGAPAGNIAAPMRSVGRGFWLRALEWRAVERLDAQTSARLDDWTLATPVTIQASLAELDLHHLDLDALGFYRWNAATRTWTSLPTVFDPVNRQATTATDRLGNFDLQAPLRCPQDGWEPDDSYFSATPLERDSLPLRRLLHAPADEDWFRIRGQSGASYRAILDGRAAGFLPALTLFDGDGVTELTHVEAAPNTETILLTWTLGEADEPGEGTGSEPASQVYLRVRAQATSLTGCDAAYTIRVEDHVEDAP